MLTTYITVAAVSYLLGSIPFGYILVKLFLKQDIRQTGSGNIGATNVARSGKKGLAIATLLLDAAKGIAAVSVGTNLYFRMIPYYPYYDAVEGPPYTWQTQCMALAALCAILGHVFPVWLRFKGGKGVATAVGAFLAFNSLATGIAILGFVIFFVLTRIVSVGSIASAIIFSIALVAIPFHYTTWTLVICFAAALVIILKHHANIRRLLNGTEPKFTTKRSALPSDPIQAEKNA